jgi:mono/diheme cytochrome c family protein
MMKSAFIGLLLSLSAVLLAGPALAVKSHPPSGLDTFMHSGCFACHGQLGNGGAGPGFRGDKMLAADDFVVARILLGGGIMPAFAKKLSDKETAAVATYIRTSWGNEFGRIDPHQVAQTRKTLVSGKVEAGPGAQGETQ